MLADDALYAAAIKEVEHAEWTGLHELMATQVEITHALLRVVLGGLGAKGSDVPKPLRVPRPGDKNQEPVKLTGLQAAMALGASGRMG